jgi:uncharacterized membrane protein
MERGVPLQAVSRSVLFLATVWCASICLAPVLAAGEGLPGVIGRALYRFFGELCHQAEDRSFLIAGHPMAVCARCASIYAGFLLGASAGTATGFRYTGALSPRMMILVALAPMMVDVASGFLGTHTVTNGTRAVTGLWFGVVGAWAILPRALEGIVLLTVRTGLFVPRRDSCGP